ncbi:sigma factor [Mycobacterium lentiflavum]|uniref:Sigma factor n=1 Tax=Mycobacterium lentiflavum TaxID=141349 RepID=A0A0E3WE53_MYCLN|nr:helix-turn-helix domain-containing protein [Mycobacterium lentiflavum]CQD23809.1 sigma factor [Mycobacterium lentiflavum]
MRTASSAIELNRLRSARERLLDEGVQHHLEAPGAVREPIMRSWRRSAGQGVPTGRIAFQHLDPGGRSELLCRSASPILDRLQVDLDGLGVAVFLSDHRGRILSRRAASTVQRKKLDDSCAAEGFDFSECAVGTNGIGTVLEEKTPLFVRGGEHFNDLLEPLTCAGAPIRVAPAGRVVGSIALTCSVEATNPMMLTLAVNAARQIEQVMADVDEGRNRALFAALRPGPGRQGRAPMVVLTPDAVLSNTAGLPFITPEQHPLLWDAVTSQIWSIEPQTIELDLPNGRILALAQRITDPTGHAYRLEFTQDSNSTRAARRGESQKGRALHPSPGVDERLRYALQVSKTIAIDGQPGTGKHHVTRVITEMTPQRPTRVVDVAALASEHDSGWFADATDVLRCGGHVIVRHLELLDRGGVNRIKALAALASAPSGEMDRLLLIVDLRKAQDHVLELVRATATVVTLPNLCEMKERIPAIAEAILSGLEGIRPGTTLAPAARQALMAWQWPGNISELRQAMVDVAARRPGWLIQLEHLPLSLRDAAQNRQLTGYERAERDAILAAVQEANGNRSKAAKLLGIGRTTLYRKIRSFHIDCPDHMFPAKGGG